MSMGHARALAMGVVSCTRSWANSTTSRSTAPAPGLSGPGTRMDEIIALLDDADALPVSERRAGLIEALDTGAGSPLPVERSESETRRLN